MTGETNSTFSVSENKVPYQFPRNKHPNLMFIAEAPGADEDKQGIPLVGKTGEMFNMWLTNLGINRKECIIANVFRYRPEGNKVKNFFVSQRAAKETGTAISTKYPIKFNSTCLIQHFEHELDELNKVITEYKPKVIVPMGAVASWSILGQDKITPLQGILTTHTFRHIVHGKEHVHHCKIVPSFHPASAITNRNPDNEQKIINAFSLAKKESEK